VWLIPTFAWGHQDVWLKNEYGDRITPSLNSIDAYSPRKTCGGCHPYGTITSGYHFQQGFDEMKDRYDSRRPWVLSPGMFGKWLPTAAAGRLAAKANTDNRKIDLSTYDWIGGGGKYYPSHKVTSMSCGACHPGGGPMEYGRDGQGRPNRTMTLRQAEALNKNPLDGDFSSQATPDKKSHFRESGVVEADCLICHMPGYRMEARNEQLGRRNYRWAASAGAGLGTVSGAVFSYRNPAAGPGHPQFASGTWNLSRRPATSYAWSDRRLFTPEGRMSGKIIKKAVASRNCLQCHGKGDAKNTGTLHTSENDAHIRAGFSCTDCHGLVGKRSEERLRHQIAKGRSSIVTVRDDLDGRDMKTCITCHSQGQYRPARRGLPKEAKNPLATHANRLAKASFHTYLIACNGCHANAQPARAMVLLDMSTGQEVGYTADRLEVAHAPGDYEREVREPWKPWMKRGISYGPVVPKWLQWFGERMTNGEIRPIPLRYVEKGARASAGLTAIEVNGVDGKKVKRRTVVSDRDMSVMIQELEKMGFRDVVYVADQVYGRGRGKMTTRPLPDKPLAYSLEHGVVPLNKKLTDGGKGRPEGCMDCHSDKAAFFSKMEMANSRGFLKDDYPLLKEPNAMPQYKSWGLRRVPSFE
jgi:hypothetical protein